MLEICLNIPKLTHTHISVSFALFLLTPSVIFLLFFLAGITYLLYVQLQKTLQWCTGISGSSGRSQVIITFTLPSLFALILAILILDGAGGADGSAIKKKNQKIIFSKVKIIFILCIYQLYTSCVKHSCYTYENSVKKFP